MIEVGSQRRTQIFKLIVPLRGALNPQMLVVYLAIHRAEKGKGKMFGSSQDGRILCKDQLAPWQVAIDDG